MLVFGCRGGLSLRIVYVEGEGGGDVRDSNSAARFFCGCRPEGGRTVNIAVFFFVYFRGRFQNLPELQNGVSAIHLPGVAACFPAFRDSERFPYLMPYIHQKLLTSKMGCLLSPLLQ